MSKDECSLNSKIFVINKLDTAKYWNQQSNIEARLHSRRLEPSHFKQPVFGSFFVDYI
jgi:hypothetical protein